MVSRSTFILVIMFLNYYQYLARRTAAVWQRAQEWSKQHNEAPD